jgi:GT2 family glycosyltransferase
MATASATEGKPLASVLICTRNRRDSVAVTVRSVLACTYPQFEVLVLDQSEDTKTEEALAFFAEDTRANYIRMSSTPGKPRALNRGLQIARGEYLLLTDDDCEVAPDLIDAIVGAFQENPRVGCIFGDLTAAPHDPSEGFIPDHRIEKDQTLYTGADIRKLPRWANTGVGANMGLRRHVVEELEGWDPCIGPGTKFRSGDDIDIASRVLRAGYALRLWPEARVVHHGYRHSASARQDMIRFGFGMGAMFAKHLRGGYIHSEAVRRVSDRCAQIVERAVRLEPPHGFSYLRGFARGFMSGMTHPLDSRSWRFIPEEDEDSGIWAAQVADVVPRSRRGRRPDAPCDSPK